MGSGEQESRVHINRNSKKKSGYEVELRDDGFYYVKSVPSKKKSGVKPGDRVLEINGVQHTEFESEEMANVLLDTLVLDLREQPSYEEEQQFYSEDQSYGDEPEEDLHSDIEEVTILSTSSTSEADY